MHPVMALAVWAHERDELKRYLERQTEIAASRGVDINEGTITYIDGWFDQSFRAVPRRLTATEELRRTVPPPGHRHRAASAKADSSWCWCRKRKSALP